MHFPNLCDRRTHLKILGVVYISLGGFIVTFVLLVLGVASYLGKTDDANGQSLTDAVTIFFILIYPAAWVMQTGWAAYHARKSARFGGIVIGAILMIGLNVLLMQLNRQSDNTGLGFFVFHCALIAIGFYTLMVLVPKKTADCLT